MPIGDVGVRSELASDASERPRLAGTSALDFDEIFADCRVFVWRVLAKLGVATADVPDLCQEVFVVVYRRLEDYDGRASMRSWIYGICVRTASSYRRRDRGRRETPTSPLPEQAEDPPQDGDLDRSRAKAQLNDILNELGEEKRAVFVLYELEELPMSEVADALGCPLQTAYSRLHAARKAITDAFHRHPPSKAPK